MSVALLLTDTSKPGKLTHSTASVVICCWVAVLECPIISAVIYQSVEVHFFPFSFQGRKGLVQMLILN
jgi:hypothetical protein